MMRKVAIMVLAMLALSGCDDSTPADAPREIGFASQMPRSIIEDVEDLQQQELRVYGSYTLYGNIVRLFDAERLYYDTSLPGWDYDNTQYWISNAVYRFYAVCPYSAPCTYDEQTGTVSINGYSGHTGGRDLLFAATERDLREAADFSAVHLHFRHACAAVQFNLINASNQVLKDVRNIRLVGLHHKGDLSFDVSGTATWTLDDAIIGAEEYEQPYGGICTLPNGGLPVNLNVKHPLYDERVLMVLPQAIHKSAVTLHLEYIKEGDTEYAVRNIELGWLGDTAPREWRAGERYEYKLTITDHTITSEVIVVDWVDNFVDLQSKNQ